VIERTRNRIGWICPNLAKDTKLLYAAGANEPQLQGRASWLCNSAGSSPATTPMGAPVHLKAGDVLVQRGTIHNWVNRGTAPCVIAFVLIAAKPVAVGGKVLHAQG